MTNRADAHGDDLIGTTLAGRYLILEKLGDGAMGNVYLGEHLKIGRRDAIKVLRSAIAGDPEAEARFLRGARMVSTIRHPNICTIYDFGDAAPGLQFLAMEFIPGETLKDLLAREGSLPLPRAIEIARQTAAALQAAHDQGIVHRDLKPGNIMISQARDGSDTIKVVDFDIAKSTDEGNGTEGETGEVTRHGFVVGTPEYMSPEQLMGERLDGRSDIYSLALVLFRMLTGDLPFSAATTQEIMILRLTTTPRRLDEARPGLPFPDALQQALDRALQRRAADRQPSAGAFAEEIAAALGATPGATPGAMTGVAPGEALGTTPGDTPGSAFVATPETAPGTAPETVSGAGPGITSASDVPPTRIAPVATSITPPQPTPHQPAATRTAASDAARRWIPLATLGGGALLIAGFLLVKGMETKDGGPLGGHGNDTARITNGTTNTTEPERSQVVVIGGDSTATGGTASTGTKTSTGTDRSTDTTISTGTDTSTDTNTSTGTNTSTAGTDRSNGTNTTDTRPLITARNAEQFLSRQLSLLADLDPPPTILRAVLDTAEAVWNTAGTTQKDRALAAFIMADALFALGDLDRGQPWAERAVHLCVDECRGPRNLLDHYRSTPR